MNNEHEGYGPHPPDEHDLSRARERVLETSQAGASSADDAGALQAGPATAVTPDSPSHPSLTPTLHEPHPELYSYEAAVNGEYPAVIHEAGEGCKPCDVSAEFYARLDTEDDARWVRETAGLVAEQADMEAGA